MINCTNAHQATTTAVTHEKKTDQECSVAAAIPYWDQDAAVDSFNANSDVINQVYVFWYNIDSHGNIHKYQDAKENRRIIQSAHEKGVSVFALIANLPDDQREENSEWDAARVAHILNSSSHRQSHIDDLVDLAERMQFDGIYIDYEAIPGKYREIFSVFIRELGETLHKNDKQLAVAIHPKTSRNNPNEDNGSHAQDYHALSQFADQLHLMTYSQHTGSATPGPPAAVDWVERVVDYAVNEAAVPREKLYLGIPFYGEAWERQRTNGYRWLDVDLTHHDVLRLMRKYDSNANWDEATQTSFITYQTNNGKRRAVWFEDRRSVARKLALAEKLDICNLSLWRLGGEDPDIWPTLRKAGY